MNKRTFDQIHEGLTEALAVARMDAEPHQADAQIIEARAKMRLAEEYDAAQDRGEVAANGQRGKAVPDKNSFIPTASDIGLSRKDIFEARQIRDAEAEEPGIDQPRNSRPA